MKILTGNDLKTGAVIWWDGQAWSLHIEDAVDATEHPDEILAREEAARHVNSSYVVDATQTPEGVRPNHIKERIRALGPTVRPDLTLKPADPSALNWVI
ncbi:DUF2849 domain-containing protein [Novosphingobium sp. PS1R-30]|uniref:DUF2849 domain-containing protein n=1 Tax=Novosphingobium anseongense TaxID=3133436 RepID=A0ABU8S193_9SPHN